MTYFHCALIAVMLIFSVVVLVGIFIAAVIAVRKEQQSVTNASQPAKPYRNQSGG